MNIFLKSLLLTWAIAQFVNGDDSFAVAPPVQQSLANLIFTSSLTSTDPQAAFTCFANYIGKLNDVGEEYKRNYTNCLYRAKESRKQVESDMSDTRGEIVNNSRNLCRRWESCNEHNVTLDLFMCHSKEGETKVKDVYGISEMADDNANKLLANYREIEVDYDHCRKFAERKYTDKSAEVYRDLKECLKERKNPVPSINTTSEPFTTTEIPRRTTDES